MSRQFKIVLEYDDREDPVRNAYLCEIYELEYTVLRDYENLYRFHLRYPHKEMALKTEEMVENFLCITWETKMITEEIESIKKKLESGTELYEFEKESLNEVISDLQRLYDIAIGKCNEHNISPENLYIRWWIDY
jgi:Na+/phosphate symporter